MKDFRLTTIFDIASGLLSDTDRGKDNPEYARALVELCTEAAGLPMDLKAGIAVIIGADKAVLP